MYRLEDLWLTLSGWDNEVMFNLRVNKTLTAIIAETTNRSMGGKGVLDYINKVIPLDEERKVDLTPEQISATIKHYHDMRAKRKAEQEKKNKS